MNVMSLTFSCTFKIRGMSVQIFKTLEVEMHCGIAMKYVSLLLAG